MKDWREETEGSIFGYLGTLKERGWKDSSLRSFLSTLKSFYRYLFQNGYILVNPLESTQEVRWSIPRAKKVMSRTEVSDFLDAIIPNSPLGMRDRALFELLYSSALRLSEAVNLDIGDVDL